MTSITVDDVSHVILVTGYTSRLNEHADHIQRCIFQQFNTSCEFLFTYDKDNTPELFIPNKTAKKQDLVHELINTIARDNGIPLNGSVGFKILQQGSGVICFDLIYLLANIDNYCHPCGNVNKIHYVQCEDKKILVLVYDCIDI